MREIFTFTINGKTITEENLHQNCGMVIEEVQDSGSASWALSTTKNPYQNGDTVQNRTANARELTFLFRYTGKVPPDEADEAFYAVICEALNGETLTVIKQKQGFTPKYIDGVIQSINRLVYSDVPKLELVIHCQAFWYGADESAYLPKISGGSPGGYYFLTTLQTKGNINPDVASFEFIVVDNDTERTRRCDLFYGDLNDENAEIFRFGFTFPVIGETFNKVILRVDVANHFSIKALYYLDEELIETEDITDRTTAGSFPQLKAGKTKTLAFSLNMDGGKIINPNNNNEFRYSYRPLYIR